MLKTWFAGDFCPREATCSLEQGALTPTNGPKIRTMVFQSPSEEYYPGTIAQFANPESFLKIYTSQDRWVKCDGQLLQISQSTDLFSITGTRYGGDGRRTFGVPDLRSAGAYYIYLENDYKNNRP